MKNALLGWLGLLVVSAVGCVDENPDVAEADEADEPTGETSAALTALPFSDGFESGSSSAWACSGNCPTIATSPTSSGRYSGNFVLTRSMATPYRTEVTVNGGTSFEFGREYWLTMNYRYEDWVKDDDAEAAPFQIHSRPGSWDLGCNLGSAMSTAPFLMSSRAGVARFVTYGNKTLWTGPVEKQKWLNIKVHFRISSGNDGFVEAWKDGVRIGRVVGTNSPRTDKCGNDMRPPYFKMGVYKWNWKEGRPPTDSTRRQLYIDDVKIWQ